jgi:hypothetical protein
VIHGFEMFLELLLVEFNSSPIHQFNLMVDALKPDLVLPGQVAAKFSALAGTSLPSYEVLGWQKHFLKAQN